MPSNDGTVSRKWPFLREGLYICAESPRVTRPGRLRLLPGREAPERAPCVVSRKGKAEAVWRPGGQAQSSRGPLRPRDRRPRLPGPEWPTRAGTEWLAGRSFKGKCPLQAYREEDPVLVSGGWKGQEDRGGGAPSHIQFLKKSNTRYRVMVGS